MKFKKYCEYLLKIEKESSRNKMIEILKEMFMELEVGEVRPSMYMLLGRIAPSYIPLEFNFSVKLLIKALASVVGVDKNEILKKYKEVGDIGGLAYMLVKDNDVGNLILDVFMELERIASSSGKESQRVKQEIYISLIKSASRIEAKYITRILSGDMRIGLSLKSIFDSLSIYISGDKEHSDLIERAYGLRADIGIIATLIKEKGIEGLEIHPVAGVPVASKLVEREKSAEGIIKRMGECFIQPKYDGLRVQIHYSKKGFIKEKGEPSLIAPEVMHVKIFSRNMEDLTPMLPEVVKIAGSFPVDSFILDGEAIGVDKISGLYMSFQDTIKRKRKYDIERMSKDFPLQVNVFDIIELNGEDLSNKGFKDRLRVLKEFMKGHESGMFKLSATDLVSDEKGVEEYFNRYVGMGLEGIIAKSVDNTYDPGTRNFDWIKLKASSNKDMVDSVDAVVMGYYKGEGGRTKFGFGALLAGIYDKRIDKFVSLAKVGTGLSEEGIVRYKLELDKYIVNKLPKEYIISKNLMPDVIIAPKVIISIEADSISISKSHGIGFSLRFPRLIEFGRDRDAYDTTSLIELEEMAKLKGK